MSRAAVLAVSVLLALAAPARADDPPPPPPTPNDLPVDHVPPRGPVCLHLQYGNGVFVWTCR